MGADQGPLASVDQRRRSNDRRRERLEAFAQASSEIFWETDDQLRLLYISPHYERLSGLPCEEALGKTLWEISGVDPDKNKSWCAVRTAMQRHKSFEELSVRGIDGKGLRYAYNISAEPLPSPLGEFRGYRGIGREVTELSNAHTALQRQALVMQEMHDAVFVVSAVGRIIDCNEAAAQLSGLSQGELIGTRISKTLSFQFHDSGWTKAALAALRSGTSWTGDIRFRAENNSGGVAETTVTPVAHPDPYSKEAIVVCRNVTAHRKAEQALRDSEARLQDVALTTCDYVWETDSDGHVTFISDSLSAIIGVPSDRLVGLFMWDIGRELVPDPRELDAVKREFDNRRTYRDLRVRFDFGKGNVAYWSHFGGPYFAENGTFMGYRGASRDISPIVRAEEQLREQAQILDQLQDSVIATDLDGNITKWNAGAEQIFGFSSAETLGKHISLTYPEEDPARLQGDIIERLFELGALTTEGARLRKNGDVFHVHSSASLLRNNKGEPTGMIGVGYDITERKWAQDALRESEGRYRSIVSALSEGVIFQDRQGRIIDWNTKAEEILRVPGERLIGTSSLDPRWRSLREDGTELTGDEHPSMITLRTGRPCTKFVMGLGWDNGDVSWLEINTEPLFRDGEEAPHAVVASFSDISERRAAEEALQRSEERYALAARFGRTAAWEIIPEDGKIYADENLTSLTGMPNDVPIPNLQELQNGLYEEDRDYVLEATRPCFEGRAQSFAVEHRTIRRDGSMGWFRDEGYIASKPGEKLRIVGTTSDITERREAEAQLHKSQKMEAVGQLTGGIAHDFNNMLAVILGNLELLRENQDPASTNDAMLGRAIRASQRGAELTQRLLAFSRRQALTPQPTDVNALTTGMLEIGARTLGESIAIAFEPGQDLGAAHVDPSQLENALLNLAINARDAMPEGGTLEIRTRNARRRADGKERNVEGPYSDYVAIDVIDTGTGMSRDILEKAFEPFFTTKEVGEGTGLGLSMVYGFTKQSGGHVDIESEVGRGTKITLYLPCTKQAPPEPQEQPETSDKSGNFSQTILVIEDDPAVRELVTLVLGSLGYSVLEASGAEQAMPILESDQRIDLLFSDIVLGKDINGVELASKARALRPDVRILLMSGYAPDAISDSTNEQPFEFIGKPFEKADLAQKIQTLLK